MANHTWTEFQSITVHSIPCFNDEGQKYLASDVGNSGETKAKWGCVYYAKANYEWCKGNTLWRMKMSGKYCTKWGPVLHLTQNIPWVVSTVFSIHNK